MPDTEIIHASEDVSAVLALAFDLGLMVQHDVPTVVPKRDPITARDFKTFDRGVFMLYRPEWVFGELEFHPIPGGHNKGKFFCSPGVNWSPIKVYFGGERIEAASRRLGGGAMSWDRTWHRALDRTEHAAPPEVQIAFDAIKERIDAGKRLLGGVHDYMVLGEAWKKLMSGLALPHSTT